MPEIAKTKILEIIARHKGAVLNVIAKKEDGVILYRGKLVNVTMDQVSIAEEEKSGSSTSIPFEKNGNAHILKVYNSNNIDLLTAKAASPLSVKLSNRQNKKTIFARLKPHLKKDLYFAYKQKTSIVVSRGKFVDMGIVGITLQLAPFYNQDLNLHYSSVFNIYTKEGEDLLG